MWLGLVLNCVLTVCDTRRLTFGCYVLFCVCLCIVWAVALICFGVGIAVK